MANEFGKRELGQSALNCQPINFFSKAMLALVAAPFRYLLYVHLYADAKGDRDVSVHIRYVPKFQGAPKSMLDFHSIATLLKRDFVQGLLRYRTPVIWTQWYQDS